MADLILIIVWACGGCRKKVKRSYARGMLIMALVTVILVAIIGALVLHAVLPYLNEFLEPHGYHIVFGL